MRILSRVTKLTLIRVLIFLLAYCLIINPASAESNSFASGALVLTSDDNIPIEERDGNFFADHLLVHAGDKIQYNIKENYRHLDCGVGVPGRNYRSRECFPVYSSLPGFVIALAFLAVGLELSSKILHWFNYFYQNFKK